MLAFYKQWNPNDLISYSCQIQAKTDFPIHYKNFSYKSKF